jgi:NAD(P)H-flavin reductase
MGAIMMTPAPKSLEEPFLPRTYQVHETQREGADVISFELMPTRSEHPKTVFLPGQFNMLYVFGIGEVPISLSALPEAESGRGLVHTIRGVGAVSQALCRLNQGDVIGLRGPFGQAWPIDKFAGHDLLVIAGGLGIAPLRPVLEWVMKNPTWFSRVGLLYGSRKPSLLIFSTDLETWRKSDLIKVDVTVDSAEDGWRGHVGSVAALITAANVHPERTVAFICGPEIMMRFSVFELLQEGVTRDHVFVSMERNMKCAIGLCGHCQYGPNFVCKDGPVLAFTAIDHLFYRSEI